MEQLPKQFVNAGVAEQNMTAMAAGMALSGKIVFTCWIANFPTLVSRAHPQRCLLSQRERQGGVRRRRVSGCRSHGPVTLRDRGHGRDAHAAWMTMLAPGDPLEARHATRAVIEREGPCYLRLGKAGEPLVHQGAIDFEVGRAIRVRDGRDVTLVSTGGMLKNTVAAASFSSSKGSPHAC